jgi:hypothetical protein
MRAVVILGTLAACLAAQTQTEGVAAEWDVRTNVAALVTDVKKLESLLRRVDAPHWVTRGAPEAYVRQHVAATEALQHLINATERLAREPERLPAAIDVYFELERMELLMNSLRDGIRKWQSGDLADMFTHAMGTNILHRDRLRQHIRDVTAARETEFKIANEEAQRCRGMLTRQTPPAPPARSKNHQRSR